MAAKERPWYLWPLIAFVVGLLIGLVVLGWGVWPVTWTNATVQDLRPDLRQQYVAMVADSYAQTHNLELARQRLAGWSPQDLAQLLQDTQTVLVARDPAEAANVQALAVALNANQARGAAVEGEPPAVVPPAVVPPAVVPTAVTGGTPAQQPSTLRQICTAGLFVLLALGALVLIVYLFRRWRAAREQEQEGLAADYTPLPPLSPAAAAAEQEKAKPLSPQPYRWEEATPSSTTTTTASSRSVEPDGDDGLEPPLSSQPASTPRPIGPVSAAAARGAPPESPAPAQTAAIPPARSTTGLQVLVENTAMYQMGEPDYDEAFDINDPVDGYMGQCGLQLIEPFGRERDQAVALQVWLWDSSDPDTQTLVLMSEGAYRDTALRSQYSGEHQAISVRPGTEFELASHDVLLRGRVEKVSYAEAEPARGVFADLQVKLTVYRRS
jgi:hypothetical protein